MKRKALGLLIGIFTLSMQSCLEEVDWVDDFYNQEMVIEAVLTDEDIFQEIILSYTIALDSTDVDYVYGAQVDLVAEDQERISFLERNDKYISERPFAIRHNVDYHLEITLDDGERFVSKVNTLSPAFEMGGVEKSYSLDERGEGISISVDLSSPNVDYFRYEIEGFREIKAPGFSGRELYFNPDDPFDVRVELARDHRRTCYVEQKYTQISFFETEGRSEIQNEEITFFASNDPVIAYGYGAYLKVYSLNPSTFEYYSALKAMALDSDVFNQVQLGNLYSTVESQTSGERMLGVFELASVRKEPFVVRYADFQEEFQSERNRDYVNACEFTAPRHIYSGPGGDLRLGELFFLFQSGLVSFVMENGVGAESFLTTLTGLNRWSGGEGPFVVVTPANCADCTKVGSKDKPAFWLDYENKKTDENE